MNKSKNKVANYKDKAFSLHCPYCGREIVDAGLLQPLRPFHILFDDSGNPKGISDMQHKISNFSKIYDQVVKNIIVASGHENARTSIHVLLSYHRKSG
jgi:hypothetical protein